MSPVAVRESNSPILLVFLRHLGCVFARKALSDLRAQRIAIESQGVAIQIVVMSPPGEDEQVLKRFAWHGASIIRDPERRWYREFRVARGSIRQVLAPSDILKGIYLATACGLGLGRPRGDCMQLGAAFLLADGRLCHSIRLNRSGQVIVFDSFVREGLRRRSEEAALNGFREVSHFSGK